MSAARSGSKPVLGAFTENDALALSSSVAAQVDARFLTLDLSQSSRISWPQVASHLAATTGRRWAETDCQRLWRFVAYGEDIGQRSELLPDSDGEDEVLQKPAGACWEVRARVGGCARTGSRHFVIGRRL